MTTEEHIQLIIYLIQDRIKSLEELANKLKELTEKQKDQKCQTT